MDKIIKKIIRVVLYIRVSSEEQARWGYSLEAQKERLIEYCKEKGYKIIAIYIDAGKTARTKIKNRKELMKLVDDSKNDMFDRIIIWKLDRWFRNVADYYKIQEVLEANNVDWECSDEDYNTTTAQGRYALNLKLADAQNESDKTSERIKFVNKSMIQNKRPIQGSQCFPLGLKVVGEKKDKRVVKDEETQHIVEDMFNSIETTMCLRQTLIYINEKYDLTIRYANMQNYLRNTLYYGCYRNVEDYCPAYLSKERWDNIQHILDKNKKKNSNKFEYIFSGLVKCKKCGCSMSGCTHRNIRINKSGKRVINDYPYYRCNKANTSALCENKKRLSQNKLEKWLLEHFHEELAKEIDSIESITEEKKPTKKIDVEKVRAKIERLNDLYIIGRITKEKYDSDYKKYNEEIESANIIKEEVRDLSKYKEILANNSVLDIYNKLNDNAKRVFWSNYIDYIIQDDVNEFKIIFK